MGRFEQAVKVLEQALVLGESYGGDPVSGWLPHTWRLDAPRCDQLFLLSVERNLLKRIHSYYFPRPIGHNANATRQFRLLSPV